MVKRFDENRTAPNRAAQIWLVLIGKAANRQTMTYGMLADTLGYGGAGTLAQILGRVLSYCQQEGLPLLTALVVNQRTGDPGPGLGLEPGDLSAEQERVFNYR